jgi:hypothetical protein
MKALIHQLAHKIVAVAAVAIILPTIAAAQEKTAPAQTTIPEESKSTYIQGLAGIAIPTREDADVEFSWGAEVGHKFSDHIAAGVYYSMFGSGVELGTAEIDIDQSTVAAFGDYYFGDNLHFGILAGVALSSADAPGEEFDSNDENFGIGGRLGYHFFLMPSVSVGPEANIIFSSADDSDPVINVFGAAAVHF